MLTLMQILLLLPIPLTLLNKWDQLNSQLICLFVSIFFLMLYLIVMRLIRVNRRRQILENEVLSIHSCSIIWQAIVLAHYKTILKTHEPYKHYTLSILKEIKGLGSKDKIFTIHNWLEEKSKEISQEMKRIRDK